VQLSLALFFLKEQKFLAKSTKALVKMTKKEGIIPNMKGIMYKLAKKHETLLTPYRNGVKIITKCSCTCKVR